METRAQVVRPLRRGQVTLPLDFRRSLAIEDDTLLEMRLEGDHIEIRPVVTRPAVGSEWASKLYERFAPVREDARAMSEQEVDALIDEEVTEVRARRRG